MSALAWIYATHPDAQLRDGSRALELAEKASALSGNRNPDHLDKLAAAHAEVGQFSDAVTAATKAERLAFALGDHDLAAQVKSRRELYENKTPYREKKLAIP